MSTVLIVGESEPMLSNLSYTLQDHLRSKASLSSFSLDENDLPSMLVQSLIFEEYGALCIPPPRDFLSKSQPILILIVRNKAETWAPSAIGMVSEAAAISFCVQTQTPLRVLEIDRSIEPTTLEELVDTILMLTLEKQTIALIANPEFEKERYEITLAA